MKTEGYAAKEAAGRPGEIVTGREMQRPARGHNSSIYEMLPIGKSKRISSAELVDRIGVKDPRELRKVIHNERAAGKLIASTSDSGGGYYIPDGPDELREFIEYMEGHALSTLKVLKAARAAMKDGGTNDGIQ